MSKEQQKLDVTESADLDLPQEIPELSEDIELMGPGQMLAQAREKLGISQQDIATKLNFRLTLVENMEADFYDSSLPETFNRGYLCSFAKLVNISNEDILNSYETLSIAKIQCAEMQSFSRGTQKEAQNSMLTWISYLIVAIFIGSTVMWWLQEEKMGSEQNISPVKANSEGSVNDVDATSINGAAVTTSDNDEVIKVSAPEVKESSAIINSTPVVKEQFPTLITEQPLTIATAIFTFSGDCWVSIYDASGERIAYGVKKTGYVMTITGKPPFKVDIGRPALTSIEFNGEAVDMSKFDKDNIAKFTLPVSVD